MAQSIRFKSSDLKTANDIQAGITPQEQQIQAQEQRLQHGEQQIKEQQTALQQQQQALQQQDLTAAQTKIDANKEAIAATNNRFRELGQYAPWGGEDVNELNSRNLRPYCNFAYSALACLRTGISASASFHSVRKS